MEFVLLNFLADYLSNCTETEQKELVSLYHKLESFYLKNGYYNNHKKDYQGILEKFFTKVATLLDEMDLIDNETYYKSEEFKDSLEYIEVFSES